MSSNLPSVAVPQWAVAFKVAVRRATAVRATYAGPPLLRLTKQGSWIVGVDEDPVPTGERLIVWPDRIEHGYIAWADDNSARKLGEISAPLAKPLPQVSELPPVDGGTWRFFYSLILSPLSGPSDAWAYRPTSVGGLRAVETVLEAIAERIENIEMAGEQDADGPLFLAPVVELGVDSYQHKVRSYGRIYVPVLTVVDWADESGMLESALVGEPEPEPPAPAPLPRVAAEPPAPAASPRRWRVRNARS